MTFDDTKALLDHANQPGVSDQYVWGREYVDACHRIADSAGELTGPQLATMLRWCEAEYCYYHGDVCRLNQAVLLEAAKRLS